MTELQPCAILANGPPCIITGGIHGIFEQCGNGACNAQVVDGKGGIVVTYAQYDATYTFFEVFHIACQTEYSHNLRCRCYVEPCLCRDAIAGTAQSGNDIAQRAVVDIEHPAPHHFFQPYAGGTVLIEIVVEQCGNQVIGRCHGVEVARKVQVDIFRGQYLCISATGSTAFHSEARPERRLTQSDDCLLAYIVQAHTQPYTHCGLAHTGFGGGNGCNKDKFVFGHFLVVYQTVRYFGDITAIVIHIVLGKSYPGGNFTNFFQLGFASNLRVCFHKHSLRL